jgi:hypothetical protein
MWTIAASMSDKYSSYEDLFYERARRYIEAAEMKVGVSFTYIYSLLAFDFGHWICLLINHRATVRHL